MPYCKYCGVKASTIQNLTANHCSRHPKGLNKGQHALYEGDETGPYECKYCGTSAATIQNLTGNKCYRHPAGPNKGQHEPAL
jgi:hypothetical protein